jgi:hypothetical protein
MSTKVIVGAVIAIFVLAILAPTVIDQLADMDTDGDTNNTEFSYLASLPPLMALFLLLGGGYMAGKKFGLI